MMHLILLAGGTGTRMKTAVPKQYLPLDGKLIVHHSLELFLSIPEIKGIVVVCAPEFRHHFTNYPVSFALPGARRQDSMYNGFAGLPSDAEYVGVHDGSRPFITKKHVDDIILAAKEHGAATLGMPVKFTVKECDDKLIVRNTPNRAQIWEIQTPQVIRYDLLKKGFEYINSKGIEVTDDVSIVEHIGHPVKLVHGSYNNIKITTPEDLTYSEHLLCKNGSNKL
jgi:2-C-methyl-D-erythritol 4-phosphate cytidylyltransferase